MTIAAPEERPEQADEPLRIPHPEDMDRATFCAHFGFRHADSLPVGFSLSPERMDEYVYECWLRFHERLHRLRVHIENEDYENEKAYDHTHLLQKTRRHPSAARRTA